jgi:phosphotransferase system IIA component
VVARRRILVALEPRVLAEAVAEVLVHIGVDDVILAGPDLPGGHFDAAILSGPRNHTQADLLIEVPVDWKPARSGSDPDQPIPVSSTKELAALLDRYCAAAESRVDHLTALTTTKSDRP